MSYTNKKLIISIIWGLFWTVILLPLTYIILGITGFGYGHPNVIDLFKYNVLLPAAFSTFILNPLNPEYGHDTIMLPFVSMYPFLWFFLTLFFSGFICFLFIKFILPLFRRINFFLLWSLVLGAILILVAYFNYAFHHALQADAVYKQSFRQKVENILQSINFSDPILSEWVTDDGCNIESGDCSMTGYKVYTHSGIWQDNIDTILSTLNSQGWNISAGSFDTLQTLQTAKEENRQLDIEYYQNNSNQENQVDPNKVNPPYSIRLITFDKDNWNTGQAINQTNSLFPKLHKLEQSLTNNQFIYLFITTERYK